MVKKIKSKLIQVKKDPDIKESAYDVLQDALESVRNALNGDCCMGCAFEALETISGCAKILKRS